MIRGNKIYPKNLLKNKITFCGFVLLSFLIFNPETFSQISPGDLTSAHAKLEGISNCTNCHVLGEKVTNEKCLNCHKEIKKLINKKEGFHSSNDVSGKKCASCHSEHNGRKFQIIRFDKDKFDHGKTGFTLTGKHNEQDCEKCHQKKFISNTELKTRQNTYLGLPKNCVGCHEDFHQKTLGTVCENCHNTETFKKAIFFDHNKTKFRLTGSHTTTDCIKCHVKTVRNGKDFQEFKLTSFKYCSSCHKDVHKGRFGNNCQRCHNTTNFKNFSNTSFDHDKTAFPLAGKHQNVKCADCHGENLASHPAHNQCIDCHKDYHKGQIVTIDKKVRDCRDCHNVYGFSPSLFTIDMHQKLRFRLTGSHLAVSCKSCHRENENWNFKKSGTRCINCHENVHGNEITEKFLGDNNCENCHSADSWKQIKFDHSRTEFTLSGKHAETGCAKCHVSQDMPGKIEYKFASLKPECETCHKDIHFGQFRIDQKSDCTRCHDFSNWKPVKFDHEKTKFSLRGAHSKLSCDKCHREVVVNSNKFIKYKLEDFKCAACHSS